MCERFGAEFINVLILDLYIKLPVAIQGLKVPKFDSHKVLATLHSV